MESTKPGLFRQVTLCDGVIGNPVADDKIRQNNTFNCIGPGDKGYVPLSHEKQLCDEFINKNGLTPPQRSGKKIM